MLEELRSVQSKLQSAKGLVPKPLSSQLRSTTVKKEFQELVDYYFRIARPALMNGGISNTELASLDFQLQELLDASHKSSTGKTYSRCIKGAADATLIVERLCLTRVSTSNFIDVNPTDVKIIATLRAFLPSAANSYEQAMLDLKENSRLSWRGPATDIREALRETLDHLAPDIDVQKQPGFKLEKEATGPTMKQKVRFVLSKRSAPSVASTTIENAVNTIEDLLATFVRSIYTRSNVSTHTPTSKPEVLRVRSLVRAALCELLEIPD